jgi:hypothetical protein
VEAEVVAVGSRRAVQAHDRGRALDALRQEQRSVQRERAVLEVERLSAVRFSGTGPMRTSCAGAGWSRIVIVPSQRSPL